ncbi:MAG TPA: ATP-binding cassette domain-containing protein [Burkholderiaceae bacterium]|nr:ATP-binding cassette domain-containing protein [Burkholderiaceae bacterium]
MIRATNLTLRRGTKVLLEDAGFVINPGERVGIVGKNGAGKSSLFALMQGGLDPDAGMLSIPIGWRIAGVDQQIPALDRPAREFVIDGDTHLRALQTERAHTPDSQGSRIAELEAELVEAGAWSAASRAEQLLAGLGFTPDQWMEPVRTFSGGWRMRLALARALMAPSELLLLDEPTNHLDLDAMIWLERWLAAYTGTVLVISHDTEFLDAVAKVILHFDHASIVRYRGGYQDFLTQRAERTRQSQIAWEKQTRDAARLQHFIDRFKAKATKAKQAQSRVKALARMQVLTPLRAEAGVDIHLPAPESMPDPLLTLEGIAAGYQAPDHTDKIILRDITLMVRGGARTGVLGVNGAGKSTLIKTLAGEQSALAGTRTASKGLKIGYFAQHQLDVLDPGGTPLAHLTRLAPDTREQELRNYLGGFGFGGDAVTGLVAPMSGGEKARLALSLIVWQKPNMLLLDEPSNHLDVDTREALAEALAEFEGSVLLVSHDRHLLRTTVDDFWIVADGRVQEFDGDLDDYRDWLSQRNADARAQARQVTQATNTEGGGDRKADRRQRAQARQRLAQQRKPLTDKIKVIEHQLEGLRQRLSELDTLIADPDLYSDARRDERLRVLAEHGEKVKTVEDFEGRWFELQEALEKQEDKDGD